MNWWKSRTKIKNEWTKRRQMNVVIVEDSELGNDEKLVRTKKLFVIEKSLTTRVIVLTFATALLLLKVPLIVWKLLLPCLLPSIWHFPHATQLVLLFILHEIRIRRGDFSAMAKFQPFPFFCTAIFLFVSMCKKWKNSHTQKLETDTIFTPSFEGDEKNFLLITRDAI